MLPTVISVRGISRHAAACAVLACTLGCEQSTSPTSALHLEWSREQVGQTYARPAVLGDVVFFATGDGRVVARDRATGVERWSAAVVPGGSVRGGNIVVRSGVVVAAAVQHAVGLEAATGRELWRYVPPRDTVQKGPSAYPGQFVNSRFDADDGTVYLPAWGASVSAVDIRTGAARWVWEPGISAGDTATRGRFRSGSMGARVSGDTVFATVWHSLDAQGLASEPWIIALDRATGHELWRVVIPSYSGGVIVEGAPALYRNLVIAVGNGGRTWAIDRSTLQVVWQFIPPARYATQTQAEVAGDMVFVDGGDECIYALDAATGAVRWKSAAGGATRDLLVTDRRLYYPTYGTLHVLHRATGRLVLATHVSPDGDVYETPAASDGRNRIYITTTAAAQSFDDP